jgi:hypothetical protein
MPLERLGTYWLDKLPEVSFREILQSCLECRAKGALPAHGTFLYPARHGYGEVWRRMAVALGDHFCAGCPVVTLDPLNRTVNGEYRYDRLVTSIPWPAWRTWGVLPPEVETAVDQLVHTAVDVDYLPENETTAAHWTYEPSEEVSFHRLIFRHNFCAGARGCWTETNAIRSGPAGHFRHSNECAYPMSTLGKPEAMRFINGWAREHGITPLGRWGAWEHMNSDVAVGLALDAAASVCRA